MSPNSIYGNRGWESKEVELKKLVHRHEGHSISSLQGSTALNEIWDAVSKASNFFLLPIA